MAQSGRDINGTARYNPAVYSSSASVSSDGRAETVACPCGHTGSAADRFFECHSMTNGGWTLLQLARGRLLFLLRDTDG